MVFSTETEKVMMSRHVAGPDCDSVLKIFLAVAVVTHFFFIITSQIEANTRLEIHIPRYGRDVQRPMVEESENSSLNTSDKY